MVIAALALAFLSHPVGLLLLLAAFALVAFATVYVPSPLPGFGVFTPATAAAILGLGSLLNSYASTVTAATIAANVLTGAMTCYLNSAATTPGNQTTRTATQLYNDLCQEFNLPFIPAGFTWEVIITQTGAGTLTLVAGTGITINGTASVAQNTTRTFVGQFTGTPSNPAFSFTSVSVGSYS
jgi:hypothetical protein